MPRRPGTKAAGPHSGEDNRALLVAGKLAFVAVSAFSYFVLTALRWTPLLFNVNDGFCVAGPCIGRFLEKLPIRVREERVFLILGDVT